ncbi:reverse transcriptase domain-containing protein, partial [Tanacetum coccineum]
MMDNNSRDNSSQQPPYKRQNVARAYSAGPSEKKEYAGTLPLCNKCKFQHNGPCTVTCANCKWVGHLTRDCRSPTAVNNQRTRACFECGNQGHYC